MLERRRGAWILREVVVKVTLNKKDVPVLAWDVSSPWRVEWVHGLRKLKIFWLKVPGLS